MISACSTFTCTGLGGRARRRRGCEGGGSGGPGWRRRDGEGWRGRRPRGGWTGTGARGAGRSVGSGHRRGEPRRDPQGRRGPPVARWGGDAKLCRNPPKQAPTSPEGGVSGGRGCPGSAIATDCNPAEGVAAATSHGSGPRRERKDRFGTALLRHYSPVCRPWSSPASRTTFRVREARSSPGTAPESRSSKA